MICPLLNAGRRAGEDASPCVEEACAWWMGRRKKGRGSCSIPRMAGYLAGLVSQDERGGQKPEAGSVEIETPGE